MLPSTVDRVPAHTADEIKEQIREQLRLASQAFDAARA